MVKRAINDGCVVPGAGAIEVEVAEALIKYKTSVKGRAQVVVQAFIDALLIILKVIVQNSAFKLQERYLKFKQNIQNQFADVDLNIDEPMLVAEIGIWDNYCVKKQLLHSCSVIATNILLVEEIMQAINRMSSLKGYVENPLYLSLEDSAK
ncbi:T-complex protein 1 subunit zeta [Saguinus oedipus]|uniref:T-complex protein 1 subunit zeta n=1 Tax=Saguinus oedipus TaxID=9490 RepID=A0ABQ9U1D1_SAGOE|nr:T-complex protein 1 subunit zeta [Saguinus oedipus]